MNYEGFKNYFGDEMSSYAIEVLVAEPNTDEVIAREIDRSRRGNWETSIYDVTVDDGPDMPSFPKEPQPPPKDGMIQAIRIHSPAVLEHLSIVTDQKWDVNDSRVFTRPFSALIYFQPKMKTQLAGLETRYAEEERCASSRTPSGGGDLPIINLPAKVTSVIGGDDPRESTDEGLLSGVEALRNMRCYIEFIDHEIMPLYDQFNGARRGKVRFSNL